MRGLKSLLESCDVIFSELRHNFGGASYWGWVVRSQLYQLLWKMPDQVVALRCCVVRC